MTVNINIPQPTYGIACGSFTEDDVIDNTYTICAEFKDSFERTNPTYLVLDIVGKGPNNATDMSMEYPFDLIHFHQANNRYTSTHKELTLLAMASAYSATGRTRKSLTWHFPVEVYDNYLIISVIFPDSWDFRDGYEYRYCCNFKPYGTMIPDITQISSERKKVNIVNNLGRKVADPFGITIHGYTQTSTTMGREYHVIARSENQSLGSSDFFFPSIVRNYPDLFYDPRLMIFCREGNLLHLFSTWLGCQIEQSGDEMIIPFIETGFYGRLDNHVKFIYPTELYLLDQSTSDYISKYFTYALFDPEEDVTDG